MSRAGWLLIIVLLILLLITLGQSEAQARMEGPFSDKGGGQDTPLELKIVGWAFLLIGLGALIYAEWYYRQEQRNKNKQLELFDKKNFVVLK